MKYKYIALDVYILLIFKQHIQDIVRERCGKFGKKKNAPKLMWLIHSLCAKIVHKLKVWFIDDDQEYISILYKILSFAENENTL